MRKAGAFLKLTLLSSSVGALLFLPGFYLAFMYGWSDGHPIVPTVRGVIGWVLIWPVYILAQIGSEIVGGFVSALIATSLGWGVLLASIISIFQLGEPRRRRPNKSVENNSVCAPRNPGGPLSS